MIATTIQLNTGKLSTFKVDSFPVFEANLVERIFGKFVAEYYIERAKEIFFHSIHKKCDENFADTG